MTDITHDFKELLNQGGGRSIWMKTYMCPDNKFVSEARRIVCDYGFVVILRLFPLTLLGIPYIPPP